MPEALPEANKIDQHLKTLFHALNTGILVTGEDWALEFANHEAGELLGGFGNELAARWEALKPQFAAAWEALPPDAAAGATLSLDLAEPDVDTPRHLGIEFFPLNEEGRQRVILLREREPADAPDRLLMSRYRSLARLYRGLRHDMKAPLQSLTLHLELLKTSIIRNAPADPAIRERQQRYVKVLEDEMTRLSRSVVNFLAQAVPPLPEAAATFNVRELLEQVLSLCIPQAREQRVQIDFKFNERDVEVHGQRDLLKQALLNLAVNALEAMSGGGRLTVRLETRQDRALIIFTDTGSGIPPEILDRIWEPGTTTKPTGTGIGLYNARSVVDLSGGTISVESRDGQGACFTLSLPIAF